GRVPTQGLIPTHATVVDVRPSEWIRAVVLGVHNQRQPGLTQIAFTLGGIRRLLSPRKSRQQERRKNADDRYDDQQFDQGERVNIRPPHSLATHSHFKFKAKVSEAHRLSLRHQLPGTRSLAIKERQSVNP